MDFTDEIMKEEIFGPILPVIPFSDLKPILHELKTRPRPLALYVFGKISNYLPKSSMRFLLVVVVLMMYLYIFVILIFLLAALEKAVWETTMVRQALKPLATSRVL